MANGDNPNLTPRPRAGVDTSNSTNQRIPKWRQATAYEADTYNVKGLTYPSDLLSDEPTNPYGGNYVIFYINVHDDSMLTKEFGADAFVDPSRIPPRLRGELDGQNVTTAQMGVVAAGAGALAANSIDVTRRATRGRASGRAQVVGDTVIGAAAGAATITALGGVNKQSKRMKTAIALHVPIDLNIKYGMQYEEATVAGASALFAAAENTGKVFVGNPATGVAGAAGAAASFGAGQLVNGAIGEISGASALGKLSGVAGNPKKEQLFKNVDHRSFTFSYMFFPRDEKEAEAIREIIHTFKLHMHPEYKDAYHFLYIYPSEFDIYYYQNGKENMNLHRHTSCVLTDMSIMYSPQGVFTSFDNGMPTQINVQLTFRELAVLTKETIKDGY
jgi:hypothetical protein